MIGYITHISSIHDIVAVVVVVVVIQFDDEFDDELYDEMNDNIIIVGNLINIHPPI